MVKHPQMNWKYVVVGMIVAIPLTAGSTAQAQPAAPVVESPWSAEVGIGFDNSISGNINSGGIGTLNNQIVVITKNTYEQVYGTGLHLRFGGGYMLNDLSELRATFTFQSLDADLTPMGDIGVSRLYGQYTDYQSFGLDIGLRRYRVMTPLVRAYGEATIGLGFVDKTDVTLVAPSANLSRKANDFYDQTAAFTVGANVGLLVQTGKRIGVFGQVGVRWVSGMSEIDDLELTGLETINDKSARTTIPFIAGVRFRF
jgi:hypothetical protein